MSLSCSEAVLVDVGVEGFFDDDELSDGLDDFFIEAALISTSFLSKETLKGMIIELNAIHVTQHSKMLLYYQKDQDYPFGA